MAFTGPADLSLREYQHAARTTDQVPLTSGDVDGLMVPLLGLAGEVGSLLTEFKKWRRQGDIYSPFPQNVSEELGDTLWYLANIASKMDLDLEEVARENLAKARERWGARQSPGQQLTLLRPHRYDADYPAAEQLPRMVEAEFRMVDDQGRQKLQVAINGVQYGDLLRDNAYVADGYRFHDVFHIAMAVLLGWSPIIRRTLACKRKSDSQVDEVEDGARAGITEEAISALVYNFSRDYSMFDGASTVEYELLRTIKMMTRAYEVHDRTPHEWETTILRAFGVWREMIANDGGMLFANAESQELTYGPLP